MTENYFDDSISPRGLEKMEYLHGFDKKEQERLLHQAKFLEPYVYEGINFKSVKNLLEVGCGVGAQSQLLLKKFPKMKITGIDLSGPQLEAAGYNLRNQIKNKRIELFQQDAQKLELEFEKFDAAFICWFLEHVPSPLEVLKQVYKHLKKGATICLTEVFNQTLFMEPYSSAYLKYWFEFNDLQWSMKGHPFVGAQLGHYLKEAGYKDIKIEFRALHFDSRSPKKRAEFVEYFFQILLSAEGKLLESKRVDQNLIQKMHQEVNHVKESKDAVFYYSFVRATAKK